MVLTGGVNLFVNYYRDTNPTRQKEIDTCLQRNIESGLFTLHLLREPSVELPAFARHATLHECAARPAYRDFFRVIASAGGGDDVNVIANSDVYFDETIRLAGNILPDEFYALTRQTVHADGRCTFYGKTWSQDAWVFRGPPKERLSGCDFPTGQPRCDGRLAFEAQAAGYRVLNPSLSIRIFHLHSSGVRNHDPADAAAQVPGEVLCAPPAALADSPVPPPFVSVIIPVYNDSARLKLCLDALRHQTYPADRFEVLVVDNGSTDDIDAVARAFPSAVFSRETAPGSYAARNKALAVARGELLAFTDSDCIPAPSWLEQGVRVLTANEGCGMIGGKIELFYRDPVRRSFAELYEAAFAFPQKFYIESNRYGATANVIACREAFETVGGFNAKLKSGGDRDWGIRVFKAGYRQIYSPDAVVRHPARYTLKEIGRKDSRIAGGWYARQKREPKLLGTALLAIWFIARGQLRSIRGNAGLKSRSEKFKVALVVLYLVHNKLCETVRILFGGEPRRL